MSTTTIDRFARSERSWGMRSLATHPPATESEFGVVLRRIRQRTRLSQSELAERADFDHSSISRLEAGARMPSRDAVDRLAEALGCPEVDHRELLQAAGLSCASDHPVVAKVAGAFAGASVNDAMFLERAMLSLIGAVNARNAVSARVAEEAGMERAAQCEAAGATGGRAQRMTGFHAATPPLDPVLDELNAILAAPDLAPLYRLGLRREVESLVGIARLLATRCEGEG